MLNARTFSGNFCFRVQFQVYHCIGIIIHAAPTLAGTLTWPHCLSAISNNIHFTMCVKTTEFRKVEAKSEIDLYGLQVRDISY